MDDLLGSPLSISSLINPLTIDLVYPQTVTETQPGLFDGAIAPCTAGIASVLCSNQNSTIKIYSTAGDSNAICFTPANPHLSRVLSPVIIYQGRAIALKANHQQSREKFGAVDVSDRTVAILSTTIIPLGAWVTLVQPGETVSGRITSVDRSVPGMPRLSLDTSKQIPFEVANA